MQIAPGCYLRNSGFSLSSPGSRAQVSVVTYEPYLYLNLSELSPILLQNKKLLTLTRTSRKQPEDTLDEESRFEDTDETLNKLEEQLNEISSQEQRQSKIKQTVLTHDSRVGIGLLSIGLITYFGRAKLMTAVTCLNVYAYMHVPIMRMAREIGTQNIHYRRELCARFLRVLLKITADFQPQYLGEKKR